MATWQQRYRYDKYLFIHAAPVVFKARVNQASFTYPLYIVNYDSVTEGVFTDVKEDMTVLFGSSEGADDLGRTRLRASATAIELLVGWSSRGVRDGELNLANDAYITVLDDYRAWAKIPRLLPDGSLYKDFAIDIGNGSPSPPVANGGVDVMQFVDASNEIDVAFDGTDSFATANGATISSYSWDFADGTPASAATSTVASVVFPGGDRWVHLTVTDSNGKTHTHHIMVVALYDTDPDTAISYSGAAFSASSAHASHPASYAFDGNFSTQWWTVNTVIAATIQVQLAATYTVGTYSIQAYLASTAPQDWTLEGSTNGSSWSTLDIRSGVTFTESETKTFTVAAPGAYTYYRLNIADNAGGTFTAIRDILLYPTQQPANYITEFEVTNQTLTRNGQDISFLITQAIPSTTYYDGCKMLYGEIEYYNDVQAYLSGPSGREMLKWSGWHDTDTASLNTSESTYNTTTEIVGVDIGGRMRQLPAFPQAVLRDAAPASWLQLISANTDRYIHYLLHWHSTVLNIAPFTLSGTGETYALPRFQSPGQNLFEQVAFRALSIAHELCITMRGAIAITADPILQDSGDRTSTVITDIDPADWTGSLTYTHQRPPRVYLLWGNAVVASTKDADDPTWKAQAVFCVAPGKAPGQGETEQTQGEQLVNASTPQDELNAREGHRYAARLNPFETYFEIPLTHPGDVGIDPALLEWVRLTITSDLAGQRGLAFADERFLPFEVDIVHHNVRQNKEVFLRAERETSGTPASTVIAETGTILPDTPDIDEWPWIYEEEPSAELFKGANNIAAFDSSSLMHITNNFSTPEASGGPDWTTTDLTGLTPALSGTFLRMVGDPYSPLYLGTGSTVNGWILTSTGIYSITDIFGVSTGPTLALQHTLASANANYGFIATGIGVQNWVIAVVNYVGSVGTKAVYTTNGGGTWTESVIRANWATGVTFGPPHCPPLFVSSFQAGLAYAGVFTSNTGTPPGALYRSTDYGATWAAASDITVAFDNYNGGALNIPFHDNASQKMAYWGAWDSATDSPSLWRTESDGSTTTNITPPGGDWGLIFGFWQLSVCPINRQRVAIAAWDSVSPGPNDVFAIFVSKDAGDTWTKVTDNRTSTNAHVGIGIAGNDPDVIYAWGYGLTLDYSQDYGATWEDKTTKLAGSAGIYNIIGG